MLKQTLLAPHHISRYHCAIKLTAMVANYSIPTRLLLTLISAALLCLMPGQSQAQSKKSTSPAKQEKKLDSKAKVAKKTAAKPNIKKLGDNRYQLGDITFNGKTREIRFPATMNLEKGLLEYILVTDKGKIHESLLSTTISPAQLQIVLKLCHYAEGVGDTFDALYPDDEKKGTAGKADRGSAVRIAAEWIEKKDGIEVPRRFQIHELIKDLKNDQAMTQDQWVYTGSIIYEGTFIAESEGTLIAVYIDNGSLINSFRHGSDDDERWITHAEVAPKMGTPVTLILTPATPEFPAK
ncbi:MAG: YceI family protein [Verrucomicrobiales bacterium]|nr:YceI family protein [Verrucomicrobiales bacterium]